MKGLNPPSSIPAQRGIFQRARTPYEDDGHAAVRAGSTMAQPNVFICPSCGTEMPLWITSDDLRTPLDEAAEDALFEDWLNRPCRGCGKTPRQSKVVPGPRPTN